MANLNLSKKELLFLACLRENSREKLTTISKKTHVPESTLFDMLGELQQQVISKSTLLLDFNKLGYEAKAFVFLRVNKEKKDELKKHLHCNTNVNNIYKINNGWDFIIETIHKNVKELDTFLDNLDQNYNIEKKEIHYLIEDVKREGFLFPDYHL